MLVSVVQEHGLSLPIKSTKSGDTRQIFVGQFCQQIESATFVVHLTSPLVLPVTSTSGSGVIGSAYHWAESTVGISILCGLVIGNMFGLFCNIRL